MKVLPIPDIPDIPISDAKVLTAVKNVNEVIAPKLFGKSVLEQAMA